jgi:Cu2+-exporting ATPase
VLVRRLQALEDSADVDTVVFDKTGTLTGDRMHASVAALRAGVTAEEAGSLAGALAARSLHPASRAVGASFGPGQWTATDVAEEPGRGQRGRLLDGAGRPRLVRLGSPSWCAAPADRRQHEATQVHLADGDGWLASFDLDEAPRDDAAAAVAALCGRGIQVQLLSGDRAGAVARIAALTGIGKLRGDCSPEDKLAHLRGLQREGRKVLMAGDGMNDGPVLALANASVAMGRAVPLAQAKADFVVPGGQVAAVPMLLAQAKRTRRIVRQNLAWAAGYNAVCVPLAVMGAMPPWLAGLGMAASSLLVVLNSARLARLPE